MRGQQEREIRANDEDPERAEVFLEDGREKQESFIFALVSSGTCANDDHRRRSLLAL